MAENKLVTAIKENRAEVERAIGTIPDWNKAATHLDVMFKCMINPADVLWSDAMLEQLSAVYYKARDEDRACKNITERTVNAMPKAKRNDTKKVFLQIASVCRIFHAGHKVNFEEHEIPSDFDDIAMRPAKKRGMFTYADDMPSLYAKISLTFDYWVPKILDWTQEIRRRGLTTWRDDTSFEHESCTDFMRIALQFLSDPVDNLPICKQDVRQALLERIFDTQFVWVKKSAKREDIRHNNAALRARLAEVSAETSLDITNESWSRILPLRPIKECLK